MDIFAVIVMYAVVACIVLGLLAYIALRIGDYLSLIFWLGLIVGFATMMVIYASLSGPHVLVTLAVVTSCTATIAGGLFKVIGSYEDHRRGSNNHDDDGDQTNSHSWPSNVIMFPGRKR